MMTLELTDTKPMGDIEIRPNPDLDRLPCPCHHGGSECKTRGGSEVGIDGQENLAGGFDDDGFGQAFSADEEDDLDEIDDEDYGDEP